MNTLVVIRKRPFNYNIILIDFTEEEKQNQ